MGADVLLIDSHLQSTITQPLLSIQGAGFNLRPFLTCEPYYRHFIKRLQFVQVMS